MSGSSPAGGGQRHRWGPREPVSKFKTERECVKGCGTVKVTWHRNGRHWAEFYRDGQCIAVEGDPRPPCEGCGIDAGPRV